MFLSDALDVVNGHTLYYRGHVLRRYTAWLDTQNLQALKEIGRSHGGLKIAQMIRLAIAEYIASESERIRASRQPLYGQGVGRALWMGPETKGRSGKKAD
jgi:hypothetical protein